MATFSASLRHVKAHLDQFVPEPEVVRICRQVGHVWRERVLGPAVTVQLFLLQLLAKVALNGLRHVADVAVTAQAICKAKQRLPLKVLMELVARSVPKDETKDAVKDAARSLWKGLTVYLADGMSFMTPDTPALARRYGKPKNQRGTTRGYPTPKLLSLMDLTGGFIHKVIALPCARQEFTCLSRLFKAIGKHGLLLGDRGLVSFAHVAMLLNAEIHGCFRLPRWQVVRNRSGGRRRGKGSRNRGKGARRLVKRLARQDLLVRWRAAGRPKWISEKRWQALAPMQLTLRQISFRVCRKGFRTHWAWIITTLLDPVQYPAQDLIELYSKRWQIEVYFRDLKQTLGMKMLSAKTVPGIQKEILAFVLLYNLVRRVMQHAANQQGTTPDRISFIDALRWLLWSSPGQASGEKKTCGQPMSNLPKLKINPIRLRRSHPRRLKNGRHRFPQLNANRAELSKPRYCVKL